VRQPMQPVWVCTNRPKAVLFDLLTALLDSWTIWNRAAGSTEKGRMWRAEYLKLTYGCGPYIPYETLVQKAALATNQNTNAPALLDEYWDELPVWSGAQNVLNQLEGNTKLAVVTNCSRHLGERAAARLNTAWDAVITAEEAGYYKPHIKPYQMALERLGVTADEAVFVAGSGYDLFGTSAVGLKTYWHNRIGLALPDNAPPAAFESASLDHLYNWIESAG
jgi:2-haloacid dehalogenase